MKDTVIGLIGAGRVARILVTAWARAGALPDRIRVFDPDSEKSAALRDLFPARVETVSSAAEAARAGVVFLGVHPPVMAQTLAAIAGSLDPRALVVSLAPKHTMAALSAGLGGFPAVARVNPSAPGVAGGGVHPWCLSAGATADQKTVLEALLAPLGWAPEVDEAKIEAYAVVSAMGPTYLWFQWKVLEDLAVEFGMDRPEASAVVEAMVQGAVGTLYRSGLAADQVMDLVPVRPLADAEPMITALYRDKLAAVFAKIRP